MMKTVSDVDRQTKDLLARCRTEKEKKQKCLAIAQSYVHVRAWTKAREYCEEYLGEREHASVAKAHGLMGDICAAEGDFLRAINHLTEAFNRETQASPRARTLEKLCRLLCELDPVLFDVDLASYWVEKAVKTVGPTAEFVFSLRERILTSGMCSSADSGAASTSRGPDSGGAVDAGKLASFEKLLRSEVMQYPDKVEERIKLVKLLADQGRVGEACDHALNIEALKWPVYECSLAWTQQLVSLGELYMSPPAQGSPGPGPVNGQFYLSMMAATDRLVALSMDSRNKGLHGSARKPIEETVNALFRLDQLVKRVKEHGPDASVSLPASQWTRALDHYTLQVYFHLGTVLLKKAKLSQVTWMKSRRLAVGLYLAAVCAAEEPPGEGVEDGSHPLQLQAAARLSVAGRMLYALSTEKQANVDKFVAAARQEVCTEECKAEIFNNVFGKSKAFQSGKGTSTFMTDRRFSTFEVRLLSEEELNQIDRVSSETMRNSLHTLTWLCLQRTTADDVLQPDYEFDLFPTMPFSTRNLRTTDPDSISRPGGRPPVPGGCST